MNRRLLLALVWGGVAFGVAGIAYSESEDGLIRRYPFDPACPWGRIANGKGMIVRCVTEQEATTLARNPPQELAKPAASASASPAASGSSAPSPMASASASTPPTPEPSAGADFSVVVGPLVADKGTLGIGKLGQPKDRYKKCITDNGGLKGDTGQVDVRFLVRSKGIAEGVTVNKRMNVSTEAARCVADVVDRRRVSVPDEPLVGATVTIKFEKASTTTKPGGAAKGGE